MVYLRVHELRIGNAASTLRHAEGCGKGITQMANLLRLAMEVANGQGKMEANRRSHQTVCQPR